MRSTRTPASRSATLGLTCDLAPQPPCVPPPQVDGGVSAANIAEIAEAGADMSPLDRWGSTPLDEAISHEVPDVVAYLREHTGARTASELSRPPIACRSACRTTSAARARQHFNHPHQARGLLAHHTRRHPVGRAVCSAQNLNGQRGSSSGVL